MSYLIRVGLTSTPILNDSARAAAAATAWDDIADSRRFTQRSTTNPQGDGDAKFGRTATAVAAASV